MSISSFPLSIICPLKLIFKTELFLIVVSSASELDETIIPITTKKMMKKDITIVNTDPTSLFKKFNMFLLINYLKQIYLNFDE